MHDVRLMRDVRNRIAEPGGSVCIPFLFEAYVVHYFCVNNPLKIRACLHVCDCDDQETITQIITIWMVMLPNVLEMCPQLPHAVSMYFGNK